MDAYIRKNRPTEAIDANLPLGIKIRNYIDNEQIRTLAEKSAWLGNDATHIINNHPDRSVIDIKKFIKAITSIMDGATTFYLNQVMVFVKTNLLVVLKSRILS